MKKLILMSCLSAFSTVAFADVRQPADGGRNCNPEGQCVVFEVNIQMDSAVDRPVVVNSPIIYLDDSNSYQSTIVRKGNTCTKQVKVPWSVYQSIAAIMSSLDGSSGEPPPAFTPAQQTMLLFYTTLMQQTLSFTCSSGDIGS